MCSPGLCLLPNSLPKSLLCGSETRGAWRSCRLPGWGLGLQDTFLQDLGRGQSSWTTQPLLFRLVPTGPRREWQGAPALETPLFISRGIWFLGISFNKPVLTHEPGAGAGLGRGPLLRESGAGTFWACSWAISAPYVARRWEPRSLPRPPPFPVQGSFPPLLHRFLDPALLALGQQGPGPPRSSPSPGWRTQAGV